MGDIANSSSSPQTPHPQGDLFHPNDADLPTPGATNPSLLPAYPHPCSAKGGFSLLGPQLAERLPVFMGSGSLLVWPRTLNSILEALFIESGSHLTI